MSALATLPAGAGVPSGETERRPQRRSLYLAVLEWSFTAFNTCRFFSYLPTLWAIHASGDSSQHSLLTWLCWLGANSSMAAWLYEGNARRLNAAIAVNVSNAVMCVLTCALIWCYRT